VALAGNEEDAEPIGSAPWRPRGVGTLNIHDKRLIGYLAMPLDALGQVLQMLIAERYRYVLLDSEPMRCRKAFIRRYEFTARYNADEYPDD